MEKRKVDIVVRAYNSTGRGDTHDFLYVEADGVRAAKMFFRPTDVDTRISPLNNITGVGFGVKSDSIDSYSIKAKEFRINPVPTLRLLGRKRFNIFLKTSINYPFFNSNIVYKKTCFWLYTFVSYLFIQN